MRFTDWNWSGSTLNKIKLNNNSVSTGFLLPHETQASERMSGFFSLLFCSNRFVFTNCFACLILSPSSLHFDPIDVAVFTGLQRCAAVSFFLIQFSTLPNKNALYLIKIKQTNYVNLLSSVKLSTPRDADSLDWFDYVASNATIALSTFFYFTDKFHDDHKIIKFEKFFPLLFMMKREKKFLKTSISFHSIKTFNSSSSTAAAKKNAFE